MRFAIIEDGAVVNLAKADADFAAAQGWVQASEEVAIGDLYADGIFSRPVIVPRVPQEVTMRQARLALFKDGLLPSVEAAINAMVDPAKTAARIEWDHSQTVRRDKGLVLSLGAAIGLSSAQIDALFVTAAGL